MGVGVGWVGSSPAKVKCTSPFANQRILFEYVFEDIIIIP